MKGLRILSKAGSGRTKIDYGFCEIVTPLKGHLENLHWILAGVVLDGRSNLEELERNLPQYEEIEVGEYRIMKPAFLPDCCKWIKGDWSRIFGVADIHPYAGLEDLEESKLLQNSTMVFRCVDAAYWEVFSNETAVIEALRIAFPNSSDITFSA